MPVGSYTNKVGGSSGPNKKSLEASKNVGDTTKTSSGTSGGTQRGVTGSGLKRAKKKE